MNQVTENDLMQRYVFAVEKLAVAHSIDRNMATSSVELAAYEDESLGHICLTLYKSLVSSKDEEFRASYMEVPLDWWEHFKERWFPARALKRWPVKMQRIKVATYLRRMCPHLDVPEKHKHIEFLVFKHQVPGFYN